ncbi:uroporphyrinogen-III C-methyltransferase [Spongiibacter sp.]|uniref:uroporphyrinogen-III C-methyltransferase n=1 Tax=Spongiibacter sp. TaxID=2024860 RepID=UPI003563F701
MSEAQNENKDIVQSTVAESPATSPQAEKSRGGGLAALALLLALAGLGLAGWIYYQLIYLSSEQDAAFFAEMKAAMQDYDNRAQSAAAALDRQRERLAEIDSLIDQQRAVSQRQIQQLSDKMQSLSTVDRDDWLLAEVEYLLRLANQRLQLSGDSRAAGRLLASADGILRELDDPALHPVRAELAKELAALQSSADFDLEGAYLQLQGLAEAAEQLEVYTPPSYQPQPLPAADASWQEGLSAGFERAWGKLRSYVRIRQHDDNFKAELAPEQADALRASLRMMLEQAQLALLAERPELYRHSLDKATAWLQRYYPLNERREALLQQLAPLREAEIRAERPDISMSLRTLKEYSKARRWQREVGQ